MKKITATVSAFSLLFSCLSFNITAKAASAELENMGVVESYNFDDLKEQIFTENGVFLDKIQISNINDGDSAAIVKEAEGDMALKITRKKDNVGKSVMRCVYLFDEAYTHKIDISFDVRVENDNSGMDSFCGFGSSKDATYNSKVNNLMYGSYWYIQSSGSNNAWASRPRLETECFPVSMTIDMVNNKYSGTVYRNSLGNAKQMKRDISGITDIDKFCFVAFGNKFYAESITADAVYYLDNIKIIKYAYPIMDVEACSASGGDVDADKPITVTMTQAVDKAVLSEYIELYKGNEKIENVNISSDDSAKAISISVEGGLEYNTEYTLKVKKNIKAELENVQEMAKDYSIDFKTASIIGEINISEGKRYNGEILPVFSPLEDCEYKKRFPLMAVSLVNISMTYSIKRGDIF